jgi:quercetin 2,3-dioxygenase
MSDPTFRRVRRIRRPSIEGGMNPEHRVRQLLEPGNWAEYDPFLMLAEDWFVPGTFGNHPHRGFETVTLVLEGSVEHRDNHGGRGVLQPGDAQWMTAGRGVIHTEEAGPEGAHTLQLWVNLPSSLKMSEPRYQDLRGADMPVRIEDGVLLRIYSGSSAEARAATRTHVPTTMIELLLEPGASVVQDLPASFNAFIAVLEGSGRFGSDRQEAQASEVVWFERDATQSSSEIAIEAIEKMRAILWAGEPIGEPVAARGPFVMNTHDEIVQAIVDYQSGRF